MSLIDTSAFCGAWPFRPLPSHPADIKAALSAAGITQAWVAPLDAAFHIDPLGANDALDKTIAGDDFFVRVGVVNPTLQNWQDDAEHCIGTLECRALKVFPNYQNVACNSEAMRELAELSVELRVPLCIQMRLQDERGHHLFKVQGVPAQQIAELAAAAPKARILACAPYLGELKALSASANVWVDISFCESKATLPDVLKVFPAERSLFASHAPIHYPAAEAAKLRGAAEDVDSTIVKKIAEQNARGLIH